MATSNVDEFNTWEKGMITFFAIVAVAAIAAPVTGACLSDGKIDYCYYSNNKYDTKPYMLIGHRPWRTDTVIITSDSMEVTEKARKEICPPEKESNGL